MENLTLQEMSKVQKKVSFVNLFTKNFKVDSIGNYSETEHENSILENISSLVCGGFPRNFDENLNEEKCILKNKDYIDAISRCYEKSNNVEPLIKFSRSTMISVIYELARNTSQNINYEKISRNINISSKTFKKYIDILMEMHLIYELNPWKPHVTSNSQSIIGKKLYWFDPCIAVAALDTNTADLLNFTSNYIKKSNARSNKHDSGILFECQVIKQLRIFANLINAKIYYYRDTNGIEVDCVIEYKNKYAICEIKLGSLSGINEGCSSLKKFRNILNETQLSNIMSWNIITGSNTSVYSESENINLISINHLFLDI